LATKAKPIGRSFICKRYPAYNIGDIVKFDNGYFEATSEEQVRAIEDNDWYHVFIWDVQTPEEIAALAKREAIEIQEKRKSRRIPTTAALDAEELAAIRAANEAEMAGGN